MWGLEPPLLLHMFTDVVHKCHPYTTEVPKILCSVLWNMTYIYNKHSRNWHFWVCGYFTTPSISRAAWRRWKNEWRKWNGLGLEGHGRDWRNCRETHKSLARVCDVHTEIRTRYVTSVQCYRHATDLAIQWGVYQWRPRIGGVSHPTEQPHSQSAHHDALTTFSASLINLTALLPQSHDRSYDVSSPILAPPPLIAETHRSMRTQLRALSRLVTLA
jgi:hypothetical protein